MKITFYQGNGAPGKVLCADLETSNGEVLEFEARGLYTEGPVQMALRNLAADRECATCISPTENAPAPSGGEAAT